MRASVLFVPFCLAAATALIGCEPANPLDFPGIKTHGLFPFDGDRTWEYLNDTDDEIGFRLVARTVGSRRVDGDNVYTVEYLIDCHTNDPACVTGTVLRTVDWASVIGDGVFIHGYTADDAIVEFSPPVQVANSPMKFGDVSTSTTGGADWTSTMGSTEVCPTKATLNWTECYTFVVATTGASGFPLAGKYWAAGGENVTAMELDNGLGLWKLDDRSCEGDCFGEW